MRVGNAAKRGVLFPFVVSLALAFCPAAGAADEPAPAIVSSTDAAYAVNADDILTISVLQPDPFSTDFTVSPDGTITFPYIGNVDVKGITLIEVQEKIQKGLSDYLKYPVVSVSLKESRSRLFYVYGEVRLPGAYPIQQNLTVVRAISTAGGFTPIASQNTVRLLRQKKSGTGSELFTVNINEVMSGRADKDVKIEPGDVITVPKSFF